MKPIHDFYDFKYGRTNYRFLPTGDIFQFTCGDILINQFRGNPKDGSANNIYLRIYKDGRITAYPLLGIHSGSVLKKGTDTFTFCGKVRDISYEAVFCGSDGFWYWEVNLAGHGETVDLLYGQDLGMASVGGVLTNELYSAQYLGHSIFSTDSGYVVCSRQNLDQGNQFPLIQQGTLGVKAVHYSTDGLQFFGTSYKAAHVPEVLEKDLPDVNYQFEFSYTGLQTEKLVLDSEKQAVFYGLFTENQETAVTSPADPFRILELKNRTQPQPEAVLTDCPPVRIRETFGKPYTSPELTREEIIHLFPDRLLEEYETGTLLSFFTKHHSHVVTQEKERLTERPHGTILTTCIDTRKVDNNLITSTNYMYGLFNGQTVTGNTSFHKFLSTPRGLLNIQKNCGQHLYVKIDGTYRLLTLPALYEMGMNYSSWYYVLPSDLLTVTVFSVSSKTDVVLEVTGKNHLAYDFILTNQLVMGEHEYNQEIHSREIPHGFRFTLDSAVYPGLHYDLQFPEAVYEASDDRIFFTDNLPRDETFLTVSLKNTNHFQCIINGSLSDLPPMEKTFYSFEQEKAFYEEFYRELNRDFFLSSPDKNRQARLDILNQTAWWYSHNCLVHYAVPHGLEQPGGAAWGTRDICQGPMEYFLMTQHYELAGEILKNIFSHQQDVTGEWPQWFMFDRYRMDAGECHGDVVFWPLKCVGDYIQASGDFSLLEQNLPYGDVPEKTESLLLHIKRAFEAIKKRFIGSTGLLTYGGGDWDDTLQPADPAMKEHLISTWTVSLAFQTLNHLSRVLQAADGSFSTLLAEYAEKIHRDFSTLLIKDGVIAGFVREEKDGFRFMLHPSDEETGIRYRLLPMTRSIIAELVDKQQAEENLETIRRELKCPDGVRLMSNPARYSGGVSRLFKRAEQAANVGREISLQYTHAHIRYLEACAKSGHAKDAWEGLFTVNPILLKQTVPNACLRQSNLYFSSSDGLFMDRYEYAGNYDLLKNGDIPVKGGWRLYSSGPGIYLNQLVSGILGIRFEGDYLILDPVLPEDLNGLEFTYTCFGRKITFRYHLGQAAVMTAKCGDNALPSEELHNPYRRGGIRIHRQDLESSGFIDLFL